MLAGVLLISSCTHTPVIPATPVVTYSKNVQAILVANCTISGCHDNSGGELFPLLTYNDLMLRNLVVPGNAKSSRLYQSISGGGESYMPPSGSLNNDDVLLIYLWIEQGAKNN